MLFDGYIKYYTNQKNNGRLMQNKNSQSGVSLVELAISVAVIGLLLAGTLGGATLIKASKLRKVAVEMTNLKQSIETFKTSYSYYPGDMPTAFDFWGLDCGADTVGAAGSCNGDGDGNVDDNATAATPQEELMAWRHLSLAEIVGGTYLGQNSTGSVRYTIGANAYESEPFPGSIYSIRGSNAPAIFETQGIAIQMSGLNGNGNPWNGTLTARNAYSIDQKLDDGLASSGLLYGMRSTSGCTDATTTPSNYSLGESAYDCRLLYWLEKSY